MRKFLRCLCISIVFLDANSSNAQCGAGYTQAQLNWDRVDYYWNSGGSAPYQNYITDAMEQNQKFAIGPNYLTIALSSNSMVSPSTSSPIYGSAENTSHTGDIAGYTGADVQYNPSSNNQTITLTFNNEASNVQFTLYDVDASQRIDFSATNAASVSQMINVVTYASSIITITNNNATNAYITANSTSLGNSSNQGSATITVAGPVKTIKLTIANVGSDAVFWLSDINACVTGSFPNNYNQTGSNQPLQGPAGNQPDYFLVTPDNNSVYMVDPANGNAWKLFADPAKSYVNSFAYDPYHHYLYYISENVSVNAGNHELKRYDFNTGTITSLVADITTTLGIPTMGSGVESAGASFYDGALYLGIEGGRYSTGSSTRTRETIFWRIDFDASQNPTTAYQAFATDAYLNASNTSIHDFGDFIIKNGVLYDFNTARNGSGDYTQSSYQQFNMMTGAMTTYNNPGTTEWNGQAGMTWTGDLYYFNTSGIGYYNGTGVNSSPIGITVVDGTGAWPGGSGDASENFRPAVDFGDAPSSYDPNPLSPASHAQDAKLKLGSNQDKEWVSRGQTSLANSDNYDDALSYVVTFNPLVGAYLTQATVFNNTGANATVCAWLDYNGNGVFDASEGITVTVATNASPQTIYLYWPSTPSSLAMGTYTYLRIRITSASNNMTTANATGYYNIGEVEDYRVPINSYPLSVQNSDFNVRLSAATTATLSWTANDESQISYYTIEKSSNKNDWSLVEPVNPKMNGSTTNYEIRDINLSEGITYYRLKTTHKNGSITVSTIRQIDNRHNNNSILITPNPVTSKATVYINSTIAGRSALRVVNSLGMVVYKMTINVHSGTNSIELPVSNLVNGTYVVDVATGAQLLRQSLIVNK